MNDNPEIGKLLLKRLEKIKSIDSLKEKNKHVFYLYNIVFEECTNAEKLDFGTLFSRIAYAGLKYELPSHILSYIHVFRRSNEKGKNIEALALDEAIQALAEAMVLIYEIPKENVYTDLLSLKKGTRDQELIGFSRYLKGIITGVDIYSSSFTFISDEEDPFEYKVLYGVADKNEVFTSAINRLERYYDLPVSVNLLDVEHKKDGIIVPQGIIIEPNYLVDVTAIAEIHKAPKGVQALLYLLKKFIPVKMSKGLLMGNISNYLLDEIITDPDFKIKDRLADIFKMYPVALANKDDDYVQAVISDVHVHYQNLKKVVDHEFPKLGIDKNKINIEPSFYDVNHGIQGRLDILQQDDANAKMDIVELKSGKVFKPNIYGLNNNHYTQTLLYDLIIKSIYKKKYKTTNYILYSQQAEKTLRFAPSARSQQIESLATRNRLLMMEKALAKCTEGETDIFGLIRPDYFPESRGFEKDNIQNFHKTYSQLDILTKKYFTAQVAFIAREQHLAKIGQHGINVDNGLASLWLDNLDQKEQRFSLLRNLKIQENRSHLPEPILVLERSEGTNALANFRKGDIGILYPSKDDVLDDQVFKCSIVDISSESIVVRLRSKQSNQRIFEKNTFWNIEPDHLDSSYNGMYRSLFTFLQFDKTWQDLWLCNRAPEKPQNTYEFHKPELTTQQNEVLGAMMASKDYYLLWGPPGTGKTSVMLRNFVAEFLQENQKPILILAYTNRAVDEICQSIESIHEDIKEQYIRIGSRYSTGIDYRDRLLQLSISKYKTRKELKHFIQTKKIVVGTLSSILGKLELFDLLNIDTVVIDEASQILDPMLSGLLGRFRRFILIGDHKQLPAVVKQSKELVDVTDPALIDRGIVSLGDSLFERLYKKCLLEKWDWSLGSILQQGRMHEELMSFPNEHFYGGRLTAISSIDRLTAAMSDDEDELSSHRRIFINAPADDDLNLKTNIHEAHIVASTLKALLENEKNRTRSIGVITPYRAQIAQIKSILDEMDFPHDHISIDTVERYQGGSRDIIIMSFCVNKTHQLQSLVSLSAEGIDRKLNVALTRVKEQIILIGNRELLEVNPVYKELIYTYHKMSV